MFEVLDNLVLYLVMSDIGLRDFAEYHYDVRELDRDHLSAHRQWFQVVHWMTGSAQPLRRPQ